MKSVIEQLSDYKSVHLNHLNVMTHFIGIPLIVFAAFMMLSLLRVNIPPLSLSGGMLLTVPVLLYYLVLHWRLAIAMTVIMLLMILASEACYYSGMSQFSSALLIFVVGWLFQFVGHYFEKAKPAFFTDLKQLLIGPLFLVAEVFFMLGKESALNRSVTALAMDKRRMLVLRT